MEKNEKIVPILIEEEMRHSYIDYSMSVIVSRALPDVRDGLKPVHRRVLYGMLELGLRPNSAYKKSARIVGEVLGKYHPHGDTAVYDAMVRMVQDFSLRYPLVDGQGNFGSIDGDSPAAMRYTEAKLAQIADEVLRDIEKNTVPFVPNFDDTLKEPLVLPSLLPMLAVNGASGIAVGMATNIPPHNLSEVIDALALIIEKPNIAPENLLDTIKGPDFPTGAIIVGNEEIVEYFKSGKGRLEVRARVHIEDLRGGRERIVVTEIPYQVNKTSLIERIASLARDKQIEAISDIRDESDREGMRISIELRKDANVEKVVEFLYNHTQMKMTFGVNLLALSNGKPKVMNIKEMLVEFLNFRHEVVFKRLTFDLDKAEKRAHILEGLKIALDNIEEIIALIRKSRSVETARANLMKQFKLSEIQAQAILDMRLQRLTGLERKKIEDEYLEIIKLIEKLRSLLASKSRRLQLIKEELLELKAKYGDTRRTQIISGEQKKNLQEILKEEEVLVSISHKQMIQRYAAHELERANDLLKTGIDNQDFIIKLFKSSVSHYVLNFTDTGICYMLRTSAIPLANNGNSTSLFRMLTIAENVKIIEHIEIEKFIEDRFIFLVTQEGLVKKIALSELAKRKEVGASVISLKEKDHLVSAFITDGEREILLATREGKAIRFQESDVRDMGLAAGGIRGMTLESGDEIVSALPLTLKKASTLLTVTSLGYGKRCQLDEYSLIKRGGKGIVNTKTNEKVGEVAGVMEVNEKQVVVLTTKKGRQKRVKIKDIKIMGRASMGMVAANIAKGDQVIDLSSLPVY
ncbi:MAG TPA: DNA gyrase subunit A [bacterium]|nr:DNA gyrase subunit A [bacterium]HPG44605.1 DNA gyrase subunit A [bacterium]HPM97163.1 DNA gyrase subunit A [bacterium]